MLAALLGAGAVAPAARPDAGTGGRPGRFGPSAAAREELLAGIGSLTGRAPELLADPATDAGYVQAGCADDPQLAEAVGRAGLELPQASGFVLIRAGEPAAVLVVGGDESGCL